MPFLSLVTDNPSGLYDPLGSNDSVARPGPEVLYLPKPANEEQFRILRLAQHRTGVTSQGPPGTGKSHTIANLICHFVACGKRVLVIAQKEPRPIHLRVRLADADEAVTDWELLDEAGPQVLADLTADLVDAADWRRKIAGSWLDAVRRECAAKVGRQEWVAFADCVGAERDELIDMRMALAARQVSVPDDDDRVEAGLR